MKSEDQKKIEGLHKLLKNAAELEHILLCSYLFAAFSMKKHPEEFEDYQPVKKRIEDIKNSGGIPSSGDLEIVQKREIQIEKIRQWENQIMFVARQEMGHLTIVQNLLALTNQTPHLTKPNFPVSAEDYPMNLPFNLMPFNLFTSKTFRYFEKPEYLKLPNPFLETQEKVSTRKQFRFRSVQQLYENISKLFKQLIKSKCLTAENRSRVVSEHFGFNVELPSFVYEKFGEFVAQSIQLILEEGEGVGGETPPLGSHFMKFESIIDELSDELIKDSSFSPSFPCLHNPSTPGKKKGHKDQVDNPFTLKVMELFDDSYRMMIELLSGYFGEYTYNFRHDLRPANVQAFFQTALFPFMTMVIRPLGEMLCRLPAKKDFDPKRGEIPFVTAGPSFTPPKKLRANASQSNNYSNSDKQLSYWVNNLNDLSKRSASLAHEAARLKYVPMAGHSFSARLKYLSEGFHKMSTNFPKYWRGELLASIPSDHFHNFEGPNDG